jgi:hypothetical protein
MSADTILARMHGSLYLSLLDNKVATIYKVMQRIMNWKKTQNARNKEMKTYKRICNIKNDFPTMKNKD